MRIEKDCIGSVQVPEGVYYGPVTERNKNAFNVSKVTLDEYPVYIAAVAKIKIACARANAKLGALDAEKARAIEQAASEVVEGKFAGNFCVNIFRGSGTPINMAVNEVVARRANELLGNDKSAGTVHPNTHVNMCQSTNDLIPTAKEIVVWEMLGKLIGQAQYLERIVYKKAEEFNDIVKLGRTCMMDALPVTLGAEFGGYASGLRRIIRRLETERLAWNKSCLGGTAVGTGVGAIPGFKKLVNEELSALLARKIEAEENLYDGMAATDGLLVVHAMIDALSMQVWKIARDVRLMCSGPRCGLGEIVMPAVAPGSSIMPGKVNPVIAEMVMSTTDKIDANHTGVVMGVKSGWLELGTSSAIPIRSFMESCDLLGRTMVVFADKCIEGIIANEDRCRELAEKSDALATLVSIFLGYEEGTKVALFAHEKGLTIKQAVLELKILPEQAVEEIFELRNLVDPVKFEALFNKYSHLKAV